MDLTLLPPSPLVVIIVLFWAVVACLIMFARGHNMMIVPTAFSLGWIGIGYLMGQLGMNHDGTSMIIRSGIVILCIDVVIGGIFWMRSRSHDPR
jgi:hypothetical protein